MKIEKEEIVYNEDGTYYHSTYGTFTAEAASIDYCYMSEDSDYVMGTPFPEASLAWTPTHYDSDAVLVSVEPDLFSGEPFAVWYYPV